MIDSFTWRSAARPECKMDCKQRPYKACANCEISAKQIISLRAITASKITCTYRTHFVLPQCDVAGIDDNYKLDPGVGDKTVAEMKQCSFIEVGDA